MKQPTKSERRRSSSPKPSRRPSSNENADLIHGLDRLEEEVRAKAKRKQRRREKKKTRHA